jgi:LexA DNA binding domain-containing protein
VTATPTAPIPSVCRRAVAEHMNRHVAAHRDRIRRRPPSERQRQVLAWMKARARLVGHVPTSAEVMAEFPTFHRLSDVQHCLIGLVMRGWLEAREARWGSVSRIVTEWGITEAGWGVP